MTDRDLAGATVLTLGDVMLDEYVWGDVGRISPEAPVPVLDIRERTHVAGGAANVAAGVVALGGTGLLGGVVGADPSARDLRAALAAAGVDDGGLVEDADRPTTTKTRVIAHSQQIVRLDAEDRAALADALAAALGEWAERHVGAADAVVLSDYGKGVVSDAVARRVIEAARAARRPVVVDSKNLHYDRYRGATVITPNQHDAARAANVHVDSEADLRDAVGRLTEACEGAALLVTRGAAGMTLFAGGDVVHVPAQARAVYDVTGAGDTVVAVLAVALGRGAELPEAVRLANAAAGIVVGKVGTATVSLGELRARLAASG
jgi:D-beta-D-heptose 7-phosphate kinase/D-beta-D-heptose 1-phosphate adenosyltransferase